MARTVLGHAVSRRANGSWRGAQIRRAGVPYESRDFLRRDEASSWGAQRIAEMEKCGQAIERRPARRVTFGAMLKQ